MPTREATMAARDDRPPNAAASTASPQSSRRRAPRKPASWQHTDALLDEALKDTFPASDPPALTQPAPEEPIDAETKE
jgi:hypothetical protein